MKHLPKADEQLKVFVEKKLGYPVSQKDFLEIKTSLFHLGRAIARYYQLYQEAPDE